MATTAKYSPRRYWVSLPFFRPNTKSYKVFFENTCPTHPFSGYIKSTPNQKGLNHFHKLKLKIFRKEIWWKKCENLLSSLFIIRQLFWTGNVFSFHHLFIRKSHVPIEWFDTSEKLEKQITKDKRYPPLQKNGDSRINCFYAVAIPSHTIQRE